MFKRYAIEWKGGKILRIDMKYSYIIECKNLNIIIDSRCEYSRFLEWTKDNYKKDKLLAKNNNLKYLTHSFEEVDNIIDDLEKIDHSYNDYWKFITINKKNKSVFQEFIEDLKDEYIFLKDSNDEKVDYKEFNGILSWYYIVNEYMNDAINNLAINEISLEKLNTVYETKILQNEVKEISYKDTFDLI